MSYTFKIKNRINWIDWAKSFAIAFVVFGHIPQGIGSFPIRFITQFHMPLFFFISGYLTKIEYFNTVTLKKYWHTLIIPYFIYNILFYPYWVVRHNIDFPNQQWFDYVKPLIGTLIFQLKTPFSDSLNGVTWFIAALLIMKILLSICNKYPKGAYFLYILFILDALFYIVNEHYRLTIGVPTVGFLRCLPFFLLGHWGKQRKWIQDKPQKNDIIFCIGGISVSSFTYLYERTTNDMLSYGICFWIVCLTAIYGLLSLCKLLNEIKSNIIQDISIGTIVIMGLHWMQIGVTNYMLSSILHIDPIIYPLGASIALTIIFIAIVYPFILLFKIKYPFMLGKWTPQALTDNTNHI